MDFSSEPDIQFDDLPPHKKQRVLQTNSTYSEITDVINGIDQSRQRELLVQIYFLCFQ